MSSRRSFRLCSATLCPLGVLALAVDLGTSALFSQTVAAPSPLSAEWRVVGSPPVIVSADAFSLPAGTEIGRSLQAKRVSVRLLSRPAFGELADSWSTLEVGPASLTFLRGSSGGGVVLLGDVPLQLPLVIPLDPAGKSASVLDFTFVLDGNSQTSCVSINGRDYTLPTTVTAGPIQVFLSAGKTVGWEVSKMEVQASPEPAAGPATGGSDPGVRSRDRSDLIASALTPAARAAERRQSFKEALAHGRSGNLAKAEATLLKGNRYVSGTAGWQIESAGKLTQLALALRQQYDVRGAVATAQRALVVLKEAERLSVSASNRQKATVQEMAAFLQEELLRDLVAARVLYEKARQLDSQSVRAKRALDQLSAADEKSRRFSEGQRKGGGS